MKRIFDILLGIVTIFILFIPMIIITICILLTSKGGAFYWSKRVGRAHGAHSTFMMPKFRTMYTDAPEVATHLFKNPNKFLTPIGGFLRKTSLDELPQLYSIIKGDMSFVGPRPALFNQNDLISLRVKSGVDKLVPGVTGWAQINGRDHLSIPDKVALEVVYLNHKSFFFDLKIIWLTFLRVFKREGISH